LRRFRQGTHPYAGTPVDAVLFQTWFDLSEAELTDLIKKIRSTWPGATLGYGDWFAPTDLRYAKVLDEQVDVYLKKQVLKSREAYGKTTLGDTNLTDYYARRHGLAYPDTCHAVPDSFWSKLHLSTHFAFSDHMLPYFLGSFPEASERPIDVHARIAVKGTEWYSRMRQEALDASENLARRWRVTYQGRVSRKEYFKELFNARICFSPFGYGEVCWRDFEAIFSGSLLVKPDMSHLECYPEIFIPHETYIPIQWDLSDLEDTVEYFLGHEREREAIARAAFTRLADYFARNQFMEDIPPMLRKLSLLD